ncbi:hypothetical protein PanWU01x14_185040 [Parasponia andersonii]|uniref:Transmembrane protein n=1 Tax=Parasponia andersonii TaxID=3476 RepID=A0A2P5C469_PARAD|nr:hypothetical protein PanWU01x14_185040 [Parasponia andersonii]
MAKMRASLSSTRLGAHIGHRARIGILIIYTGWASSSFIRTESGLALYLKILVMAGLVRPF